MALWQRVQKLCLSDKKEILQVYSTNNIPIELRDVCAAWIENSIGKSTGEQFCSDLRKHIQENLQTNRGLPFYLAGKLEDFQNTNLSTKNGAASLEDMRKRFQICLEAEKFFVSRAEGLASITPTPPAASVSLEPALEMSHLPALLPSSHSSYQTPRDVPVNFLLSESSMPQPLLMDQTIESYNPEEFLNNPVRIIIDGEMSKILEAEWNMEESNNIFSIKCHEVRRLQELHDQQKTRIQGKGAPQQDWTINSQLQEQNLKIQQTKSEILQVATKIHAKTLEIRTRSLDVMQNWGHLKTDLGRDLSSWMLQQKLNANGKPVQTNINRLQNVAEYLMEVAWKLRGYLVATEKIRQAHQYLIVHNNNPNKNVAIPEIPDQIAAVTSLIKKHVQDTFVVLHQPCQVLKTNTRFHILPGKNPMEICLLVGNKLSLELSPPPVSVCIVDEATCKEILTKGLDRKSFKRINKKGRLIPETARLDYCHDKKCSSAVFRQISLKDFYRNARKGTMGREQSELVTEEKFALLFRSEFYVGDIGFQVWRLSFPIVITTHGSQDNLAWAAVTWDNAFSSCERIPFQLPDFVSWEGVRDMLNGRFASMVGASLTQENIEYFADRLSIYNGFPDRLTWSEVCKNFVPGRKFTFWEWYFEGTKLIEQHLKDAWHGGYVKGFIGKESSENMLCNSGCLPGTFLLRFSESTLGGLSIVWLHSDGTAYSLAPFKSKDLALQPIVEKFDQEALHYVYPNTKKEIAFKKYYEEYELASRSDNTTRVVNDGYIRFRNQLVLDNPGIPRFCLSENSTSNPCNYGGTNYQHEEHKDQTDSMNFGENIGDPIDIDIDIDELLNFACVEDSMDSSWYQNSSMNEAREEVSSTLENKTNPGMQYEESFYLEL